MLGMVIPLSFLLHYKYMEMTAEMFHAARPRRAAESPTSRPQAQGGAAGPGTPPGA